ncbi:hypothetical protein GCM10011571_07200 [Marinithermofilum abyssi]|uniref:Uncharacterized protein n=2 Tax=Marinithermofilum abyssi TaxID=1571185 RepID=A0A8J2YA83_9BACL|nr:hypothetical protein GCM10011571_07200 [Marinithermofilum abyssi]
MNLDLSFIHPAIHPIAFFAFLVSVAGWSILFFFADKWWNIHPGIKVLAGAVFSAALAYIIYPVLVIIAWVIMSFFSAMVISWVIDMVLLLMIPNYRSVVISSSGSSGYGGYDGAGDGGSCGGDGGGGDSGGCGGD